MTDGYELDYKKVHNTLGEPNECKYGEEIGQYVTNLWPKEKWPTVFWNSFHIEGMLIENASNYLCSNDNYLYGRTFLPGAGRFVAGRSYDAEIYLIDLKQTVSGQYNINSLSITSISVSKSDLPAGYNSVHFKVIKIKDAQNDWWTYNSLNFLETLVYNKIGVPTWYWHSLPIPLTANLIYNFINENKEKVRYYICGYDIDRDEYVWINATTGTYNGTWEENAVFRCPDTGVMSSGTQTISGFSPKVDQWYIVFYNLGSSKFNYDHFFFGSSIPLVISKQGKVVKDTYSEIIIQNLPKFTIDRYSDEEALRFLKSHPPIIHFNEDDEPESLELDEDLQNEEEFINWLIYKNYNLVLVTLRDHTGTNAKTTHQYAHHGDGFTIENKRYGILRYLFHEGVGLKMPTYEWTPTTLDEIISFDTLDDEVEDIQDHILSIYNYKTCAVEQIPNQCQLCTWDDVDEDEYKITHICFALATIKKNSRQLANNPITLSSTHCIFNGSHVSMSDIPINDDYYNDNRCILKSL